MGVCRIIKFRYLELCKIWYIRFFKIYIFQIFNFECVFVSMFEFCSFIYYIVVFVYFVFLEGMGYKVNVLQCLGWCQVL